MSSACFIQELATKDTLLRVTNMCAECYSDLNEGDTIHYDMQNYRYICQNCQEEMSANMTEECEDIEEEETPALF